MCQNTMSKFYYKALPGGSQELKEMIIGYLPSIWSTFPPVQCNDMHVLLEQFIAESEDWDMAMIAYNQADDPVAILAVSGICQNVYQHGLGVHVAHIFTLEKRAGAYLYKELIKLCESHGLYWIATYHPSPDRRSMTIRYHTL